MSRLKVGLIAGVDFGVIDIIPMLFMDLPNRNVAIAGAFTSRFAIGFLIPNTALPFAGWVNGLLISSLMSIPDAIITSAFGPILGFGAVGGIIIGFIVGRKKQ